MWTGTTIKTLFSTVCWRGGSKEATSSSPWPAGRRRPGGPWIWVFLFLSRRACDLLVTGEVGAATMRIMVYWLSQCHCPSLEWRKQVIGLFQSPVTQSGVISICSLPRRPKEGWCCDVFLFSIFISIRWSLAKYGSIKELVRFLFPCSIWTELGLSSHPPRCRILRNDDLQFDVAGVFWSTSTISWPLLLRDSEFQQGCSGKMKT